MTTTKTSAQKTTAPNGTSSKTAAPNTTSPKTAPETTMTATPKTTAPNANDSKTTASNAGDLKATAPNAGGAKAGTPNAAERGAFDPRTLVLAKVEGPEGPPSDEGPASPAYGPGVSRQTLEQTPGRSLVFLRAVGTSTVIRATMAKYGYTEAEHALGWRLMQEVGGHFQGEAPPTYVEDREVQQAIAEVDAWDEDGLRIVNAALRARHPEQHAFVMRDLTASTGIESVLGVATLLDRLDALESAAEREATRESDHAALATLAARGIDKAERERLRGRVEKAKSFAGVKGPEARAEFERRVRAAMIEQRRWLEEWSDVARSVIKRRDQLIRLGLASRRSRRPAPEAPPGGPDGEPGDEPGDDDGAELATAKGAAGGKAARGGEPPRRSAA